MYRFDALFQILEALVLASQALRRVRILTSGKSMAFDHVVFARNATSPLSHPARTDGKHAFAGKVVSLTADCGIVPFTESFATAFVKEKGK